MEAEILAIMKWVSENLETIIKEGGIEIVDVIEEPMAHPHYHSRMSYSIEYGEDDYGVVGIMADMGLSGSPSAWNHYRQNMDYISLADDIWCRILEAEDSLNDDKYKVYINEELYDAIIDANIIDKYILAE